MACRSQSLNFPNLPSDDTYFIHFYSIQIFAAVQWVPSAMGSWGPQVRVGDPQVPSGAHCQASAGHTLTLADAALGQHGGVHVRPQSGQGERATWGPSPRAASCWPLLPRAPGTTLGNATGQEQSPSL